MLDKHPMPTELEEHIKSLPPSSINNSRHILRETWNRISHLNSMTIERIMEQYGVYLDGDRSGKDYGGDPHLENNQN